MGVSNKTCGHCKYKLPVLATMCVAQITVQNISTALQHTSIGITNTLQCSELIEPEGTFNSICWYLQHIWAAIGNSNMLEIPWQSASELDLETATLVKPIASIGK